MLFTNLLLIVGLIVELIVELISDLNVELQIEQATILFENKLFNNNKFYEEKEELERFNATERR